jgi:hypothetical protein
MKINHYRHSVSRAGLIMRRSDLLGVLGIACCSVLGISGCSFYPSGSSGSPADVTVVESSDRGAIGANPKILGRDGGYSGVFAGYAIWLYGDTFLAHPNAQGQTLISDSWSFTSDFNAQDGITGFQEREDSVGAPTMLLELTAAEQAFNAAHAGNPCQQQPCGARWALWPGAMVADPARNRALVFYQLVSAQPGNFNFQTIGYSVAVWQNFADLPQRPTINPAAAHPDLLFSQSQPSFGSAALVKGDTLYAYGCYNSNFSVPCVLGRVNLADVTNLSVWTFYAGNGNWSSQPSDARWVFSANHILNVSWNDYLQRYVAVYNQPLSGNVMIRTAPAPEGPWSAEVMAFEALQPAPGQSPVDDAQAHPEYNANGGQTIFVTYTHGTGPFTSEERLVSVQLQRVAASVP